MKKKIKYVLVILSVTVLLLMGITVFLIEKMRSAFNDEKVVSELIDIGIHPSTAYIPFGEYQIHTKAIGDPSAPKVLFIHGSPGYWFDFKKIFSDSLLVKNFQLIAFDRAGFGKTTVPAMKNLANQARITNKVLEHYTKPGEKSIVLGHSFGGAVLEQFLLDFPEKVRHAIYVAPCLSPEYQEAKWYNLIASGGLPQRIMPHELKNSNKEMLSLSECLQKNETQLFNIETPTTYIQGKKDILVPYQTLDYYKNHHQNIEAILLDELNHFVPWSKPELIVEAIYNAHQFTN
ncbi:alpha/beta fold hydrolase [Marinifilum caeruleilacunae]|uniref:Alpha/beta hydrolase n=1 Tax=Marinifilum caeruleilacunae TaxID=2499076 RepID=A0ABX1WV82_9BACT|nr:alpha/beta hydrolase [Marinifilum caeruleilacunae]NOU59947.1 alpha/beta hydrolase [Marinifilum caeruleilacunae]